MKPQETFEPVSGSGSEKPWEAHDSEPGTEREPSTQRSSEHPIASSQGTPESVPKESGERVVGERIVVAPDLGVADRRHESVSGDRTKAPFASSVMESESDDKEAAA